MGLNLIVRQLNAWIYHRVTSQNYFLIVNQRVNFVFIWFQDSHKIYNDFSTLSLQFVPYFSKFIIIFQLVLRRIHRVALEIAGEKLYISQLPGLQYKKEISLTSTSHAGNLRYANQTNKLRKTDYIMVKAKTNS